MNLDNLKTIAAIRKVVDYLWEDEKKDFEALHDVEVVDIPDMIRMSEHSGWTDHIFYQLMIIKNCKFYR
jgi:hypothetical protein